MTSPQIKDGPTVWWCPSRTTKERHTVDLEARSGRGQCDCSHYRFRSMKPDFVECYHIKLVFRAFAEHKLKEIMVKRGTLNQRTDGP